MWQKVCKNNRTENNTLLVHEGRKNLNNLFQCNSCDKIFKRSIHLEGHSLLNHKLPCKSCNKNFVKIIQLKMHNLVVQGEK